jgi:hypothetical protein
LIASFLFWHPGLLPFFSWLIILIWASKI